MKILILGVGNSQVDAIRYCKQNGHTVCGVSYRREGRGIELVDEFAVIDICDWQGIKAFAQRKRVDLIYSVGSDLAMPTLGRVSRELGLPYFVDGRTAEILNNKAEARRLFAEHGLSSVPYRVGKTIEDLAGWTEYPAIIKPVDSQGQRGVFEVRDHDELRRMFPSSQRFSRVHAVIVEQYIRGPEFSCNAFVKDGKVIYSFVSDRLTIPSLPGGIVCGHRMPSCLRVDHLDSLVRLVETSVTALGISNGPVYFQAKFIPGETKPALIEVTPRLDGCHIWRLIDTVYGVDLLDLSLRMLMGDSPLLIAREPRPGVFSLDFFQQEPNTSFQGVPEDGRALYTELYYRLGETVRPINERSEKVGYQIRRLADPNEEKEALL